MLLPFVFQCLLLSLERKFVFTECDSLQSAPVRLRHTEVHLLRIANLKLFSTFKSSREGDNKPTDRRGTTQRWFSFILFFFIFLPKSRWSVTSFGTKHTVLEICGPHRKYFGGWLDECSVCHIKNRPIRSWSQLVTALRGDTRGDLWLPVCLKIHSLD